MASRSNRLWPVLTVIVAVAVFIVALPSSWKTWAPSFLNPGFHFGLDLAGGTQLDFRISEEEILSQLASIDTQIAEAKANNASTEIITQLQNDRFVVEEQRTNLVEAIRTVLERRINALGVSEATITPSFIGGEKHLLVECPGVVDVQECIETVGKTIQLEFKEEQTEATAEFEQGVRAQVAAAEAKLQSGVTLSTIGEDLGDNLGVGYEESRWLFRDQLPTGLEDVWDVNPTQGVIKREGSITVPTQDAQGQVVQEAVPGIFLLQILSPRTQTGRVIQEAPVAFAELARTNSGVTQRAWQDTALDEKVPARLISTIRSMQSGDLKVTAMDDGTAQLLFLRQFVPGREEVDVSHILIGYKGAQAAEPAVTRTKEEALALAQDLKRQIAAGASFEELARTRSDGPSRQNAGKLEAIARGELVPSFEAVAFSAAQGVVSDPVETPFGYHLIRVDNPPHQTPDRATFDALTVSGTDAEARANDFLAQLQSGQVTKTEEAIRWRTIFFSLQPTGWRDTALDGKHFRTASVTLDPTTNLPVVQIVFDEEGGRLFQELTKNNIGKRIAIFVGGELVSAPTVQGEIIGGTAVITGSANIDEARQLAQDLNTGAIPAPIHLTGQRTVEATLGEEALRTSVLAAFFGMIVLMLYMFVVYRFFGLIANLGLLIYAVIFLAILKLPLFLFSSDYIVLTLAGAAGMILSIGMAVDTNVLVFERVKEELRKGKALKTAVEVGFEKAWPSVRDSNISTLITCALLFMIGTSIVRGFAVTLGMGVLISMVTGMVISRWIARRLVGLPAASRMSGLFPGTRTDTQAS